MTTSLLEPHSDVAAATRPEVIVEGDGCYVVAEDGRRYLEGVAGLWCATLGFSEPRLADAAAGDVDSVGDELAAQRLEHGIGHIGAGAVLGFLGGCAEVRGDHDRRDAEQR